MKEMYLYPNDRDLSGNMLRGPFPSSMYEKKWKSCKMESMQVCSELEYPGNCGIFPRCQLPVIYSELDLRRYNFRITQQVPGDGNCQFHALAAELNRVKTHSDPETHVSVRQKAASYIRDHQDVFLPYWDPEDSKKYLTFTSYTYRLQNSDIWGPG